MAWCVHLQTVMEPYRRRHQRGAGLVALRLWLPVALALEPPRQPQINRLSDHRVCLPCQALLVRLCRSGSGEALSKLQPALFLSNVHVKALKIGLVQEIDACALRLCHCRFVYLTDAGVFSPSTCTWIPDEHLGWE